MRIDVTYPCVVGRRIVELTAEQRDAHEWRLLSPEGKIAILLARVEALERAHGIGTDARAQTKEQSNG